MSIAFLKKIHNDLLSDNDAIGDLLKFPVALPHRPSVRSTDLPPIVKYMMDRNPDIARAIAIRPDLINRLRQHPYLVHPLTRALSAVAKSYCSAIEETNRAYRDRIERYESLRLEDCAPTWLKGYRVKLYNDVFLRDERMRTLLADSHDDLTAGSAYKDRHPVGSYDRCYYVILGGGIGFLVLSGSPPSTKGKVEICFSGNGKELMMELKVELPETPRFQAETRSLFKGRINQSIRNSLDQYWDGIRIGFMTEAPKESDQLPQVSPLTLAGRLHGYKEREIPYYHGSAFSGPEVWIDISSNRLAWVPSEWKHMENHPGSWIMAIVQMLSPMANNGSTKALQHRLRDLSSHRWRGQFKARDKRAPALPPRLNRNPEWSDVDPQADRPMNEAQ